MRGWTSVNDLDHGLTIDVPTVAPSGAAVDVAVDRGGVTHRIHVQTADGSEVYVEVVSYAGMLDRAEAAADQRDALRARSPEARISEPASTTILDRPGTTFDFSGLLAGTPRDRRFIFVDTADRTVRVVLDPTSPANQAILETLGFA